jgi:hypothetical protein
VTHYREPEDVTPGDPAQGLRCWDAHVPEAYIEVVPQETGNVEITVGIEGDEVNDKGYFVDLPAQDRVRVGNLIAGEQTPGLNRGEPAQRTGTFQVIVDTAMFGETTAHGTDRLLQRIAWHLRNGIPGLVQEPGGGQASINEVGNGNVPVRMKEVRRHFRYKVTGSNEWKYHSSFKVAQLEGGHDIEFQRSYKSDWEPLQ